MAQLFTYLFFVTFCLSFIHCEKKLKFYEEKKIHQPYQLSDLDVQHLASLSDMKHFRSVLDEIMIPRVVGTPGHTKVGDFIADQMRGLGWKVEEDRFEEETPVFGVLNFRNIVATLNPNADRYLVLACHYDSKYVREYAFIGATDSAVPCAMMINLAKVMAELLQPKSKTNLSLMFIFFDGEEAFKHWGPRDSIYGARNLAHKMQSTQYKGNTNHLHRIDVLMLLDLLGTPDPIFYSYFKATERWYVRLAAAEQMLAEMGQLQAYSQGKAEQTYFRLQSAGSYVEDDHIPFLRRNVDILHVIPSPFPDVWHTSRDNMAALDFYTIDNLNKILRVFVAEYLHLQK